jgi:hypothetical protein
MTRARPVLVVVVRVAPVLVATVLSREAPAPPASPAAATVAPAVTAGPRGPLPLDLEPEPPLPPVVWPHRGGGAALEDWLAPHSDDEGPTTGG